MHRKLSHLVDVKMICIRAEQSNFMAALTNADPPGAGASEVSMKYRLSGKPKKKQKIMSQVENAYSFPLGIYALIHLVLGHSS